MNAVVSPRFPRILSRFPFFVFPLLVFLAVQSLGQRVQPGTVDVQVRSDADEQPVHQAEVRVSDFGQGNAAFVGFTDSAGTIEFGGVSPGSHIVIVKAVGFEPASGSVDVVSLQVSRVTLQLVRSSTVKPKEGGPAPVDAASLTVPEEAKREYDKGVAALEKDPEVASKHLEQATQKYPKYTEAYAMLGLAYFRQKKLEEAKASYDKAIETRPDYALPHIFLGRLYLWENNYQSAASSLQEGLRLAPTAWDAAFELARCYYRMGDTARALEYAKRAHDSPMAPPATHLLLVDLYMKTNDRTNALKELKEFAATDPKSPHMPRVRSLIKELEKH